MSIESATQSVNETPFRRVLLVVALLAGNVALACGPWLVRLADTGPVSAGFWRLFLALPFLALLARGTGQKLTGIPRRTLLFVALGSIAFGLDLASWHIGIELTRLGNATLFGNAGSIVLMVWAFLVARMLPRGREWLAIAFALLGSAILLGRSLEISFGSLVGDMFSLTAGLLYAVYLLTLKDAREGLGHWSLLVWVSLIACPILLAIGLLLGEPVWPTDWTPVVILAVTSQLVGMGLMIFAIKHFSPLIIGLALLTEPIVAALIGYRVFGEALTPIDVLGMVLVGSALVIARMRAA